jgi:hypothetical protein
VKSSVRVPASPKLQSLLEWHYKSSIINCWGSLELRQLIRVGFEEPGDDEVADVCFGLRTPSSSPGSFSNPFSCCNEIGVDRLC